MAAVWLQSGSSLAAVWLQSGSSMAAVWQQSGNSMAAVWLQSGSRLAAGWLQSGCSLAAVWQQSGSSLAAILFLTCYHHVALLPYIVVQQKWSAWQTTVDDVTQTVDNVNVAVFPYLFYTLTSLDVAVLMSESVLLARLDQSADPG